MAKMIQIRNVPDGVHRTLKARAAAAGMTLSDYLLAEVEQVAARPTMEEILERLHRIPKLKRRTSAAEMIREHRDGA